MTAIKILLLKTIRDLRRSLPQTLALAFIIMMGVASYIALVGAYRDLGASYNHTYDQLKFADLTFEVLPIQSSITERIAKQDGVSAITSRLIIDAGLKLPGETISTSKEKQIRSRLIGLPMDAHPQVNDVLVLEGRYLEVGDKDAALVESHFANTYHLSPGDTITPILNGKQREFTIVGVVASPEYLIVSPSKQEFVPTARTFAVLFVPLDRLQDITSNVGIINNIAVRLQLDADANQVKEDIRSRLKPLGLISTTPRKDHPSHHALQADLDGYREIANLMPGIILLVAAFSVYVMLGRQVRAQQPQIGVMKALGYKKWTVVLHYLTYALAIGLLGSLFGIIAGLFMVGGITTMYAGELGIPLVKNYIHTDLIWKGNLLMLFFCFFAGVGPALATLRMPPAQAMRQDPATAMVKGRFTIFDRLVNLPVWLRISIRNIFRVRRRSISTGIGIIFSFILILMTWGMLDSMNYMMDQTFHQTAHWDITASFNDFQSFSVAEKVKGIQGITAVEPSLQLPATINPDGEEKDVLLTAFSSDQQLNRLTMLGGVSANQALSQGKIVMTQVLAKNLRLKIGDPVKIEVLGKKRTLTLGGINEEMMTANAYISLDTAGRNLSLPSQNFTTLYITVNPVYAAQTRTELYNMRNIAAVLLKSEMEDDWMSLMGLFYAFIGIMLAFGAGMAFALLFNAMTVNVLEREREFATMRSIGTWRKRIAVIIITENLILWLLALIPGVVAGYWVAIQIGNAFQTELFSFKMLIYPSSYILSALGILLTMLVATVPAIRRVNHLDLSEATKVLN